MNIDRNAIQVKLKNIFREVIHESQDQSLLNGSAGRCLFRFLYSEYFENGKIDPKLGDDIQKITDEYFSVCSDSLANGKAGINWFFFQMYKSDLIDLDDLEDVFELDKYFGERSLEMLSKGNYDFLHGSLGIAYYLLDRKIDLIFFKKYFLELNKLCSRRKDGMLGNFDFVNNVFQEDRVNIGLAHGVISILKFCLECYSKGICEIESYSLAKEIIRYIKCNQNLNTEFCYFSNIIVDNEPKSGISRLAWCYGDLTIAYILFQCARRFSNKELEAYSLEIFDHSMKRITVDKTFVRDAGICHGAAGIAHIYHKMWFFTNDESFGNACDFWIGQILNLDKFDDNISGYKSFYAPTKTYRSSSGLLDGSTGIGLVLLSYLTKKFDWDYCLMLN